MRTSQLETTRQEKEVRQLCFDLDHQAKLQQALQRQFAEERQTREALAKQLEQLLKQSQKKDKAS
jgi:hypothetical protein